MCCIFSEDMSIIVELSAPVLLLISGATFVGKRETP